MAYRFVVNALTHYATPFGNNCRKEKVYKIMVDFVISIRSTSRYGGVPLPTKYNTYCFLV